MVRWRGDRAWREYAAQSAARGEILDVLPGPSTLPPERNFMKAPVLDRWLFGPFNDPHLEQFRFPWPRGWIQQSGADGAAPSSRAAMP